MKSLKSKNEINQAAFAPNMYDPLGMYGCFPALMTFETYEPLKRPRKTLMTYEPISGNSQCHSEERSDVRISRKGILVKLVRTDVG